MSKDEKDPVVSGQPPAAEPAQEQEDFKDKYLRTLAELDNFRKRTERERAADRRHALENFLRDLLPVIDSLEMARKANGGGDAICEGVALALSDFYRVLADCGCEVIPADVGQPFDPRVHDAVALEPAGGDTLPNTVLEELRPGFRLGDRILRPSHVKVAMQVQKPEQEPEQQG